MHHCNLHLDEHGMVLAGWDDMPCVSPSPIHGLWRIWEISWGRGAFSAALAAELTIDSATVGDKGLGVTSSNFKSEKLKIKKS